MNAINITDSEIESYLLGAVEGDTAESIDELTFIDEDFASRVGAIERDLIDEYLRKELDEDRLRRFETYYLQSEKRRAKVRLSRSFGEYVASAVAANEHPIRAEPIKENKLTWQGSWWKFAIPAFAAAILLAVALPVWYVSTSDAPHIASEDQSVDQGQSDDVSEVVQTNGPDLPTPQPTKTNVNDRPNSNSQRGREANGSLSVPAPRIFAITLLPQTRGSLGEVTMSPPARTDRVAVTLRLEPTDQRSVAVELREVSSDRIVWRTVMKPSKISGGYQSVRLDLPDRLLSSGRYAFIVTGRSTGAEPEIIGEYPFKVVR